MKYLALVGIVVALTVACGSKKDAPVYVGDSGGSGATTSGGSSGHAGNHAGGSGGRAGSSGEAGEAGEAGGGDIDELAPVVTITSPTTATDPNNDAVVSIDTKVKCDVTKGPGPGATLASDTVTIEAFDSMGKSIKKIPAVQTVQVEHEFTADFVLTGIPSGSISFTCTASDMSTPPKATSQTVKTFLDQGPTITLKTPKILDTLSYYALNTPLAVDFVVTPSPLSAADTQAAVDNVTLKIGSVPIDISKAAVAGSPGEYSLNVLLSDPMLFPKTPDGPVAIEIDATNKRKNPGAVTATLLQEFGVDGSGPVIKIISPASIDSTVLGKVVTLQFTVTDAQSLVDQSTVTLTFNKTDVRHFDLTAGKGWSAPVGDTYSYLLDTTTVPGSKIQLHVEVTASDRVANPSDTKNVAAADYWLDTTIPTLDLNPRFVQDRTLSGSDYYCSDAFDPLGDSPNDGEIVPETRNYRAMVWDETNTSTGQTVFHYAGIDIGTVELYAQADLTQPLLADSDGDGTCDKLLVDSKDGVTSIPVAENLQGLPKQGHAYYEATSPTYASPPELACVALAGPKPDPLCSAKNSDMFRVIDHNIANRNGEDVIYTSTSNDTLECTGKGTELSASIQKNGWVCLAAQATDYAGNKGISAPLRLCLNATGTQQNPRDVPSCAQSFTLDAQGRKISTEAPPSCVLNNCKLPTRFPYSVVQQVEN